MKSSALERKSVLCLVTLLAAAIPVIFTACGSGAITSASASKQASAPTVASVAPDSGPPAGGMAVTITGSNFTTGTQQTSPSVSFGGVQATHVTVLSSAQLSAMIPAHTAGTVTVQVTTADGESTSLPSGFTYTSSSATITSVSPISGPANGGTAVTVSGNNFQSGASVSFGGLAASSITVSNSTTIKATTPTHSSGPVTVTVTNPDGQSATLSSGFAFHSVDLAWNPPSATSVTIAGYNLYRAISSIGPFGKLNGSTPLTSTSFTDASVQGGTTYYYKVTSVGSNGAESSPDGPVPATTSP